MFALFFLLFIVSVIALIVGLIKPELILRWGEEKSRGKIAKIFGAATVLLFILSLAVAPEMTPEQRAAIAQKREEAKRASEEAKKAEEAKMAAEQEKEADPQPTMPIEKITVEKKSTRSPELDLAIKELEKQKNATDQKDGGREQMSAGSYKEIAAPIVKEYSELMINLGETLTRAGQRALTKDELSGVLARAADNLQSLISKVDQLDKKAVSIYYPGESIRLTTYLSNAIRGTSMVIKSLEEGNFDGAKVWLAEANKDFQKFLNGYNQLK